MQGIPANISQRLKFLKKYKEKYGNCNVPSIYKANPRLASWVASIRTQRRYGRGQLSQSVIRALDELGFVWDWQAQSSEENWMRSFQKLILFKERFGHCNVLMRWEEDRQLAGWVSSQRTLHRQGKLTAAQVQRLDEIGFVWDYQAQKARETWMKWYCELEAYTREHGNSSVPRAYANSKLASWVWIQRIRRGKPYGPAPVLTEVQIALLDKLGFCWDVHKGRWAARIEQLKQFKAKHGHCEVRLALDWNDDLRIWVNQQRLRKARGQLAVERREQLDALGFTWAGTDHQKWLAVYELLKIYYAEHGHSDVPCCGWRDRKLASWVGHQRLRRRKGLMPKDQIQLLDAFDFTWRFPKRGRAATQKKISVQRRH